MSSVSHIDPRARVRQLIADHVTGFNGAADELTDATTLDSIGADSLDAVEITIALEDEFGIEISDARWNEIPEPRTVGGVCDLVMRLRDAPLPGGSA